MFKLLTAVLPLASFVSANPIGSLASQAQLDQIEAANNVTAKIIAIKAQLGGVGCAGQSCDIADLAGSTGRLPKLKPEGGGTNDFKCIGKYNPEGLQAALKASPVKAQPNGISGSLMGAAHGLGNWIPGFSAEEKGSFTGTCSKNIVIFAKGTTEPGQLGITVGPALNAGLPYGWTVVGVPYTADLAGDYCLGLPGGMVARDMLNQAAKKCPDSKIFMSGYSQGGMISHNAIAYADEEARKHVAVSLNSKIAPFHFGWFLLTLHQGVIVFGDPFQGAPIKGYSGPIVTYCNDGDFVCTGNFVVGTAHLSYVGSISNAAIKEMKKIAAGDK
jgi:hypothetical protein